MLLEELYERLVHPHRIPGSIAEEEGSFIAKRLHELLEEDEAEQEDKTSQSTPDAH